MPSCQSKTADGSGNAHVPRRCWLNAGEETMLGQYRERNCVSAAFFTFEDEMRPVGSGYAGGKCGVIARQPLSRIAWFLYTYFLYTQRRSFYEDAKTPIGHGSR
jgi:hypothetical protein